MEASFRERIGIQLIAAFPDVCRQIIVRFLQLPRNEFSARRHVGLKYGREDSYPSDRGNLLYSRKEERGNFRPIEFDRSLYRKTLPILQDFRVTPSLSLSLSAPRSSSIKQIYLYMYFASFRLYRKFRCVRSRKSLLLIRLLRQI